MSLVSFFRGLWNTPPRHSVSHRPTRKRRFDGALRNKDFAGWVTTGNSSNADIWSAITTLRNRARDLLRNNDYARGAIQKYVDNVIFEGITFQSQVKQVKDRGQSDERINNLIEQAFKQWANEPKWCHTAGKLDFVGIQQLVFRSVLESGEVFVKKVKQSFSNSPVPYALEIIEADQLAEDHNSSFGGNRIIMGVEVDRWQRPIAYWFHKEHPGELFQGRGGIISRELERVSANDIIHLHLSDRPNQLRGLPILYSTILRLKNVGDYETAEQLAAKLSACIMGLVKTPYSDILPEHKCEDGEPQEEALPADEKFAPGMMRYMAPGEEFEGFNPQRPNANLVAFIEQQLRATGAGIGLSYESVSNDYSKTNYSSSRLSLITSRDRYKVLQKWFAKAFLKEVIFGNCEAAGWLDLAVMSGVLTFGDYELRPQRYKVCKWQFRGWGWVDPHKEVKATIESLAAGITTYSDVYSEAGKDFEESIQTIARERAKLKELGIEINLDSSNQHQGQSGEEDNQKSYEPRVIN